MGSPWYRPTRVTHATSGSEFGWRSGTGKWPAYYIDSLPGMIDIGPGSPVGVEFGYGLVPSARGDGLATEAVRAALVHAATHGARRATAETELDNAASRRVLEKAGLVEVGRDGDTIRFERDLRDEAGSLA